MEEGPRGFDGTLNEMKLAKLNLDIHARISVSFPQVPCENGAGVAVAECWDPGAGCCGQHVACLVRTRVVVWRSSQYHHLARDWV